MSAPAAVRIAVGGARLDGDLALPPGARTIVCFAHGSGSSRRSPRNRQVAAALGATGIATLLMDLLTADEGRLDDRTAELRFDVALLARRLVGAVDWLAAEPATKHLAIGLFGASTGAAAALLAAVERPSLVRAVVSRGGRPDLAGPALAAVRAPTLLIVGGDDPVVVALNRDALASLAVRSKELAVVPGATHLFEEPGALDAVARLASDWFRRHVA